MRIVTHLSLFTRTTIGSSYCTAVASPGELMTEPPSPVEQRTRNRRSEATHPVNVFDGLGLLTPASNATLMKLHLQDRVQAVIFAYESGLT
jgi:hypothetical protein